MKQSPKRERAAAIQTPPSKRRLARTHTHTHTLQSNKDARLLVPFFFLQKEPARTRAQIARARVPTREKT